MAEMTHIAFVCSPNLILVLSGLWSFSRNRNPPSWVRREQRSKAGNILLLRLEASFYSHRRPNARRLASVYRSKSGIVIPRPISQSLQNTRLRGVISQNPTDPSMRPLVIKGTESPTLPVGKNPIFTLQAFRGTPCSRPIPRSFGFGRVVVKTLSEALSANVVCLS